MNGDDGIQMTCTCGACPEQWEGTVDGNPAYFRLRHSRWTFVIAKPGASLYGGASQDETLYEESGDHNIGQDAGVMEDAPALIAALVSEYRRGLRKASRSKASRSKESSVDSFLKFLEDNCPGDDAHDGCAEPDKPLLLRCGMCASIYEAHLQEMGFVRSHDQGLQTIALTLVQYIHALKRHQLDLESCQSEPCPEAMKFITGKKVTL
jgi:hypothetical protein